MLEMLQYKRQKIGKCMEPVPISGLGLQDWFPEPVLPSLVLFQVMLMYAHWIKEPTTNVSGHGIRVRGRSAGLPAGVDEVQLQAGRPGAGTAQVIHAARAHALLGLHGQRQEGVICDLQ